MPIGRKTKGYVSAYDLDQVQKVKVQRTQKRSIVADVNGAVEEARTITEVTWRCTSPWATLMENPSIASNGKSTAIDVVAQDSGWSGIKATIEMDNGEILSYQFEFEVTDQPLYPTELIPVTSGPFELVVP